jgi:type I restriction enzyme S subunit
MAKKEKLSLEELLEQALVKDEDKPYNVPNNWIWTKLGNIATIVGGGTPSTLVDEYYTNGDIAWITPADLSGYNDIYISNGKRNITRFGLEKSSARLMPKDTVILSSRAPIGYVAIASNELCTNQGFKSFLPSPIYRPKFLYFYLIQNKGMLEIFASGTTFLELSGKKVSQIPIPIPPLSEQKRIEDLIESLFEKLDRAKELAQNAFDSFENRKSAILHKTFMGELTAKWRDENGVDFEKDWVQKKLGDVCKSIYDGDHMPPPKVEDGIPFLVISNMNKGIISFEKTRFVPQTYFENISETRKPSKGDILYSIVGSYGIPAMVETDEEFCFQRHIALLKPNPINNKFLFYILQSSDMYNEVTDIATGTAQLTVPIRGLRNICIHCPPLYEQEEIVRILDNLLKNEQKAKELSDVIENIERMKKSILARAFRGELSTNNPNEESALELLKEALKCR